MLAVAAIQPGVHQRLAEARAADRRVAADDHPIPVRFLRMGLLDDPPEGLGLPCPANGAAAPCVGIIISPSRRDDFRRPGGSHSVAAPMAPSRLATSEALREMK